MPYAVSDAVLGVKCFLQCLKFVFKFCPLCLMLPSVWCSTLCLMLSSVSNVVLRCLMFSSFTFVHFWCCLRVRQSVNLKMRAQMNVWGGERTIVAVRGWRRGSKVSPLSTVHLFRCVFNVSGVSTVSSVSIASASNVLLSPMSLLSLMFYFNPLRCLNCHWWIYSDYYYILWFLHCLSLLFLCWLFHALQFLHLLLIKCYLKKKKKTNHKISDVSTVSDVSAISDVSAVATVFQWWRSCRFRFSSFCSATMIRLRWVHQQECLLCWFQELIRMRSFLVFQSEASRYIFLNKFRKFLQENASNRGVSVAQTHTQTHCYWHYMTLCMYVCVRVRVCVRVASHSSVSSGVYGLFPSSTYCGGEKLLGRRAEEKARQH